MVSEPNSGTSGLASSPGRGHCVVFLGRILNSHSAPLQPGVQMITSEFHTGCNPVMDLHLIQGGVEILLVDLCCGVGITHFMSRFRVFHSKFHSFFRIWPLLRYLLKVRHKKQK